MLAWPLVYLGVKYGKKGWTALDIFCLSGAILAVALWQALGNATFGIIITCLVVMVGSMPVFVSAWDNPEVEDKWAWLIFFIGCVFQMAGVVVGGVWTLDVAAQPIAFTVVETVMMYILFIRPRFPKLLE
jgi:hypothetical protein